MLLPNDQKLSFSPPALGRFLKKYGEGERRAHFEPLYQEMLREARLHAQPQYLCEIYALADVAELSQWLPSLQKRAHRNAWQGYAPSSIAIMYETVA